MDVGKSFTYMFEDKEWITKLAIGGVILLAGTILSFLVIPIIAAFALLLGYTLVVIRNVYEGNPTPLPRWDNIGDLFVKGLTALVGALIWALPIIVLAFCVVLVLGLTGGLANSDTSGARALASIAGLVILCLYCILFLLGIGVNLFIYAPLTNFALTNRLSEFWDFQGALRFVRANVGNYLIAFLLALVANFVASFGVIACVIGIFFTSFWAMLVIAHLFGQVARTNLTPTDSTTLPPPATIDQPPSMTQGPFGPAPIG